MDVSKTLLFHEPSTTLELSHWNPFSAIDCSCAKVFAAKSKIDIKSINKIPLFLIVRTILELFVLMHID